MPFDALSRNHLLPLVVMLVALATLLPIGASVHLARQEARDQQEQRALFYARDVLRRSEDTARQIGDAFTLLATTPASPSCNPARREVMERIDAVSSYIQFVGLLEYDRIVCGSYGEFEIPLLVGAPDLVSDNGYRIWLDLRFPFAADTPFIGIGNEAFIAVIHKSLPVDTTAAESDVSLAIISLSGQRTMATRGRFLPAWMPAPGELAPGGQSTRPIGRNIVSQVRSRHFDLAAVAALHDQDYGRELALFARILVPIGVLTGLLLAYAVTRVAKVQMSLPAVIRSGLRNGEFFIEYQPIVRLSDRRWVGAEALIRWHRPGGQLIRPEMFIPAAEDTSLIHAITVNMLQLVEPTLAAIARRDDSVFLSINLSRQDLHEASLEARLHDLVARTGIRPEQLHLEITERGLAETESARRLIDRLRAHGLRVCADDFGTGYSSLSELVQLNLDTIKIDKAFVDTIDGAAVTSQVAAHIVEMAHALSLGMIAEGVERESQVRILLGWRVQLGQGYLFARAMSGQGFLEGLAQQDRSGGGGAGAG
jgi:sensor c-di-GMP phosphodiesterase-like protein